MATIHVTHTQKSSKIATFDVFRHNYPLFILEIYAYALKRIGGASVVHLILCVPIHDLQYFLYC
jgi:hypothetical protein